MLTPREIEDRMEEAARTLRRLPNPPGSGPSGYGSSWPDYVRSRFTAYGRMRRASGTSCPKRSRTGSNATVQRGQWTELSGWLGHHASV